MLDEFLSIFFTVIIRHGYMPKLLRNCTLIPVPKPGKDPSRSDNYRPIALAPNLSKVLEWSILLRFGSFLSTSDLQFGFKPGVSTDSCTGLLKNTIALHLYRDTKVYGCFLDASKAFDRVSHNTLFSILEKRGVPHLLLRFLWSWYKSQSCAVKWNACVSESFEVANGVRQGGVLSPILFTVYLDELLQRLTSLDIGCHVGHHYVGSLCYADDIALLAPSPSALRILLRECELFATEHNLQFNAAKTQLICFRSSPKVKFTGKFFFSGHLLEFSDTVTHLGHVLHCSLDDGPDIKRATLEMCKKANVVLSTFSACDPHVKTVLFSSHCLSLYGGVLWDISCNQIKSLEVAFNNILRRIWKLPRNCHTRILHKVARLDSVFNRLVSWSNRFSIKICQSKSALLRSTFSRFLTCTITPVGHNHYVGQKYQKIYFQEDVICADFVRFLRLKSTASDMDVEPMIYTICCD